MTNRKITGYALGIVAAASYGMNPLFALPLYEDGMNPDSVLLFRYLLALPVLGAMLLTRGHTLKVSGKELLLLSLMGIMVAISSLSLFAAYNYMAAGIASTLLFVYPIMVALLMAVIFRERIRPITCLCLALALTGIGLLYKGDGDATLSLTGTILVIISSLSYAIYIVAVNKTSLNKIPTLKLTFYILASGSLLFAVRLCAGVPLITEPLAYSATWINLLALALIPTALSYLCTTAAIKHIGPTPTAILGAFEPVTAIIFGITVFGEILTARDIAGITLIIGAVSMVIAADDISNHLNRIRRLFPRIRRPFGKGPDKIAH